MEVTRLGRRPSLDLCSRDGGIAPGPLARLNGGPLG
jgi:hypothetical protein